MPYRSLSQERYFNAHRKQMEAHGVDVGEWNRASRGMKLPKCVGCANRVSHIHKVAKK